MFCYLCVSWALSVLYQTSWEVDYVRIKFKHLNTLKIVNSLNCYHFFGLSWRPKTLIIFIISLFLNRWQIIVEFVETLKNMLIPKKSQTLGMNFKNDLKTTFNLRRRNLKTTFNLFRQTGMNPVKYFFYFAFPVLRQVL